MRSERMEAPSGAIDGRQLQGAAPRRAKHCPKRYGHGKISALLLGLSMIFAVSCGDSGNNPKNQQDEAPTFAEVHDAFETKLARKDHDNDPIPEPPEGAFDLVYYPSKVGNLAAYVSSDPGDGEKHPLIIWVVGGWGNGISEFPWYYPEWDDDQTGSAYWQAGVLTMYPSFRGGSGNPGYYETLFGEVDDISSAYDYAASLPYVDPDRIYLGGHSTGGTRALLAAEYTDKFRAVFCFGAVDEIKYHNNSQFTFDTDVKAEYAIRSPIHWLKDVKTPTFLFEGSGGNAASLNNIQNTSENENIHCYLLQGEDHFSVLAPLTRLTAQKILGDTGAKPNISITQAEVEEAMKMEPEIPLPVMVPFSLGEWVSFSYPFLWEVEDTSTEDVFELMIAAPYEDDNVWDASMMFVNLYEAEGDGLKAAAERMRGAGYDVSESAVGGQPALEVRTSTQTDGGIYKNLFVVVEKGELQFTFDFVIHESYGDDAEPLFRAIIDSITFE